MKITLKHPDANAGTPVILDDLDEPYNPQSVGLKEARKRLGMTAKTLGDLVGRSEHSIRAYEQGRLPIPIGTLIVLMQQFRKVGEQ